MARYAISAEGAASMRALAKQLYTEANSILESSATLEAKVSAVGDGLGIYEAEILGIVQQSRNTLKANRDDILDLAQRVLQKADEIDELVALSLGGAAGLILSGTRSAVQEYEASNLYPTGSADSGMGNNLDGGYTRHLSSDEVNARWQSGVESINEQIENYREALLEKGVPECKWLNETLAKHRAQMLEQQGYDLDVASGHGADSVHNSDAYHYPGDYSEFYNQLADEFRQYSLTETNPHYSEAPHWRDNCQRCVPALEMRRRGEEVTARPSTYGSSHLAYRPFDVWQNPTVLYTQGSGKEQIDNSLASWGDGARAQVVVYWDGPHGGGHTFIAERRNGETIFSDPQTGRMDVSNYFNRVIPNTTQYCRIDNQEFSSYIDECYQEVA